jgi:hypothetical protein
MYREGPLVHVRVGRHLVEGMEVVAAKASLALMASSNSVGESLGIGDLATRHWGHLAVTMTSQR